MSNGAPIAGRGIISVQFIKTGAGWKMNSMTWDDERDGLSILDRYTTSH